MLGFGLLVFHKLLSLVSHRNREVLTKNAEFSNTVFQVIFIRGVDEALSATEEFLGLVPMMDTTTANNIFNSLVRVLNRVVVDWPRAVSIATDSASSMIGKKQVL